MSRSSTPSKTSITIEYGDQTTAEAIRQAITPDNVDVPEGMTIETVAEDGVLTITVDTTRSIGSLVATLDDMLSCIQAAEKALGEL
ncbi:MAG: KEOPS complex subunit Pcc1 [Candidatus Bathyarchaeota archaeon]|nr:KEOPS complex subunit Pcc1 [Candidatus Bathyarchaeota archaeon]